MGTKQSEIKEPLITPLSRKYYDYATNEQNLKHYRATDVRICLEKICDEIIIDMVSEQAKSEWKDYDLHSKLKASKHFLNKKVVSRLIAAKIVGNSGTHEGEEGEFEEEDIEEAIDAIRDFSIEIFVSYFEKNGFKPTAGTWIPTAFSTLPPIYRIEILERYYLKNNSWFVIDKLSKAYMKAGRMEKAEQFLLDCYKKHELTDEEYCWLVESIKLLESNKDLLPISKDLQAAQDKFNALVEEINVEEKNAFIYLLSSILNGKENDKDTKGTNEHEVREE